MGYYSSYSFIEVTTVDGEDVFFEDLPGWDQTFSDQTGYNWRSIGNDVKWYNYFDDMLEISLLYPDVVFTIERVGEDPNDRALGRFLNGKGENVLGEITYGEFKEIKEPYSQAAKDT